MSRPGVIALVLLTACRVHFDPLANDANDGDGNVVGDGAVPANEIEIVIVGHGVVLVAGQPACTGKCRYTTGPLQIDGQAGEAWELVGLSAPCSGLGTCAVPLGSSVTVTFQRAPITANVAFFSSTPVTFAGIASLDSHCASLATAAGLPGTFIALASTSTVDASTRVGAAQGWVRPDGLPIIDTITTVANNNRRALTLTETGATLNDTAFTGTNGAGMKANTCTDWTGTGQVTVGFSQFSGFGGFSNQSGTCSTAGRTYCLQTDRTTPVTLQPPPLGAGRYIFLTVGTFTVGGGIAAADALCASEAAGASLLGDYAAVLATTTQSAADHVGGVDGVWRRTDGMAVTFTSLDAPSLDTLLLVNASGTFANGLAFFGAQSLTALATTGSCADWTSTAPNNWQAFEPASSVGFHSSGIAGTCNTSQILVCAQRP